MWAGGGGLGEEESLTTSVRRVHPVHRFRLIDFPTLLRAGTGSLVLSPAARPSPLPYLPASPMAFTVSVHEYVMGHSKAGNRPKPLGTFQLPREGSTTADFVAEISRIAGQPVPPGKIGTRGFILGTPQRNFRMFAFKARKKDELNAETLAQSCIDYLGPRDDVVVVLGVGASAAGAGEGGAAGGGGGRSPVPRSGTGGTGGKGGRGGPRLPSGPPPPARPPPPAAASAAEAGRTLLSEALSLDDSDDNADGGRGAGGGAAAQEKAEAEEAGAAATTQIPTLAAGGAATEPGAEPRKTLPRDPSTTRFAHVPVPRIRPMGMMTTVKGQWKERRHVKPKGYTGKRKPRAMAVVIACVKCGATGQAVKDAVSCCPFCGYGTVHASFISA